MCSATSSERDESSKTSAQCSPRGISVALCTYNGARFLNLQLESIAAQTLQPAELIVCDDRSTDDTVDLLRRFQERAPFPVRIELNQYTLGSTKNFEKAIGLCTGEFIAPCDQDDVWLPEKLALGEKAFAGNPNLGLVFSDADVVDEEVRPLGHTMWDGIRFGRRARSKVRAGRWFEVLLRQWFVTGATMMFRADLKPLILPIPEIWIHDGWIAVIAGALAPLGLIEQPLVKYRQHSAQQIGGKKLGWRELYTKARELGPLHYHQAYERFLLARERIQSVAKRVFDPAFLTMLDEKVVHQKRRLEIVGNRSRFKRILEALRELLRGGYSRYSPDARYFLKDMFL
jgi:glycosyltransferase involved in cell wall biosynthesis